MIGQPIAGEEILTHNHSASNHNSVGGAQKSVAGEAVAAEDGAADDGLQQIVGEAHTTEEAEMTKQTAHCL